MADGDCTLILLRHGESQWNALNLFTGWVDVDLTDKGRAEAARAGELIAGLDRLPDGLHLTASARDHHREPGLDKADRHWIPVHRNWRLNERHYGGAAGAGQSRDEGKVRRGSVHGVAAQLQHPPPPIERGSEFSQDADPRYADINGGP